MFAVIRTGGKQYRVSPGSEITIESLPALEGASVAFTQVLMVGETVGTPTVEGATVVGAVLDHTRGPKVIAFKKRRRQNSRRKRGHRQDLTVVRIDDVLTGGAKPTFLADARALGDGGKTLVTGQTPDEAGLEVGQGVVALLGGGAAAVAAAAPAGGLDTSNLSLISGIGPTIEKKLRGAGILNWEQIAAWTEADVADWNEKLALRGRATREEWVEQAKELLAGKPPRAKADRAEQASGEDY